MPKPWARYEIGFIDHDKFRAINANAICLWQEGKNYCDSRLTDGLIPEVSAKHFRFYSRKAVVMLTTSCGLKPGTSESYAPLWELVEAFGFKMHEYLDYNDCRKVALERIATKDLQKQAEADRKAEWRAAKKAKKDAASEACPDDVPPDVPDDVPRDKRDIVPDVPSMSRSYQNTEIRDQKELSLSAREKVITDEDIGDRARELLEAYVEWYRQERHGARLRLLRNTLEFQDACDLCRHWDDAHLAKLAKIVLTTNDEYISRTDRGFKIFALKATWADDRLREWEQKNGVAV